MKNHHDYPKINIGNSDIATLVFTGCNPYPNESLEQIKKEKYIHPYISSINVSFGYDGSYFAYVVDDECTIPDYYRYVKAFSHWLVIYDDEGIAKKFYCDSDKVIKVYRANMAGCIIQISSH